jgi:hypothetical protein
MRGLRQQPSPSDGETNDNLKKPYSYLKSLILLVALSTTYCLVVYDQ